MKAIRTRHPKRERGVVAKRITLARILEVAFWGTVIWGVLRIVAHYFHFTPYGIGAFARPFLGTYGENSLPGIALGTMVLFIAALAATFVYALVFGKVRFWWIGILYGLGIMFAAGYFFRMGHWDRDTFSTEAAWYLSFGLFIGMTLVLERFDEV